MNLCQMRCALGGKLDWATFLYVYVAVDRRLRIRPKRKGTLLILSQAIVLPSVSLRLHVFGFTTFVISFF